MIHFICFMFLKVMIYLFNVKGRQRQRSPICWFILQTLAVSGTGPGRIQEPETQSMSPTLVAESSSAALAYICWKME